MEEGTPGKRLRNVTEPPPARLSCEAVSLLLYWRPSRPTSRTLPANSKEVLLTVLLRGSRKVRVQVVKVTPVLASWRNSASLRERRKPPEADPLVSRAQALPFQAALRVNHTESLSAYRRSLAAAPPTPRASRRRARPVPSLGWRMALCWPAAVSLLR
ncbi:hypothetical protein MYXA107069_37235 [Myxococcus xanthus]